VDGLDSLPSRMSAVAARVTGLEEQILQLRTEMRGEFSDARLEMRARQQQALSQSPLLYEDLRDRIILLSQSRGGRKKP
jgi:hypothetical protein